MRSPARVLGARTGSSRVAPALPSACGAVAGPATATAIPSETAPARTSVVIFMETLLWLRAEAGALGASAPRAWPTVEQGRPVMSSDLADAGHVVWTELANHCLVNVADLADHGAVLVARLPYLGMVPASTGLKRGRARGTTGLADDRAVVLARLLDAG